MARKDLREQITIFPPDGKPGEKHSLLNARDLITHKGWTTTPQSPEQFTSVADLMSSASREPTPEEVARQALINKPIDQMTREEVLAYAEEEFQAKIDKRLNLAKAIDRLKEIADASNFKLKFSTDEAATGDDEDEDGKDEDEKSEDQTDEDAKDEDEKSDSEGDEDGENKDEDGEGDKA